MEIEKDIVIYGADRSEQEMRNDLEDEQRFHLGGYIFHLFVSFLFTILCSILVYIFIFEIDWHKDGSLWVLALTVFFCLFFLGSFTTFKEYVSKGRRQLERRNDPLAQREEKEANDRKNDETILHLMCKKLEIDTRTMQFHYTDDRTDLIFNASDVRGLQLGKVERYEGQPRMKQGNLYGATVEICVLRVQEADGSLRVIDLSRFNSLIYTHLTFSNIRHKYGLPKPQYINRKDDMWK